MSPTRSFMKILILLAAPAGARPGIFPKQETAGEQALEADTLRSSLQSGERRAKEVTTQLSRRLAFGRAGSFGRLTRLLSCVPNNRGPAALL